MDWSCKSDGKNMKFHTKFVGNFLEGNFEDRKKRRENSMKINVVDCEQVNLTELTLALNPVVGHGIDGFLPPTSITRQLVAYIYIVFSTRII
jgi:hypothetical protein